MNKCKIQNLLIRNGFTLMELLVVIAIIGMLAGMLMPTLNIARERGRRAVCVGNLKVIGEAFNMYNIDIGEMPPIEPPNNVATNRIGKAGASIVQIGLGYFYNKYIEDFGVYVCPSSINYRIPEDLKNRWNANTDTFCAYIYRAASGGNTKLMLSDSKPAIVMDYNSKINPTNYNHKGEYVNILSKNGSVKGVENKDATGASPDGKLTLGGVATDEDELFDNADKE